MEIAPTWLFPWQHQSLLPKVKDQALFILFIVTIFTSYYSIHHYNFNCSILPSVALETCIGWFFFFNLKSFFYLYLFMSSFFTGHIYFHFIPSHLFWNFLVFSHLLCLTLHRLSSPFNSFYLLFCLLRRHFLHLRHLVFDIWILPFSILFFTFYFRCTSFFFTSLFT